MDYQAIKVLPPDINSHVKGVENASESQNKGLFQIK